MKKKLYFLPAGIFFTVSLFSQPFSEGFNAVSSLTSKGWVMVNNSSNTLSPGNWTQGITGIFSAQNGPPNSYAQSYTSSYSNAFGSISNWLILPRRTLYWGDEITFYTRNFNSSMPDKLEVRMSLNASSTNVGTTSSSVGDFTTVLTAINEGQVSGSYPGNWMKYSVTLPINPSPGFAEGRIAFRHVATNVAPNRIMDVGIDNINYYPQCGYVQTIRVDGSVTSSGNGGSWGGAYKTIGEALEMANRCIVVSEIWVKKGTYYPATDNRPDSSFRILRNGIRIYGGFAGGEINLSQRKIKDNPTILSGDIGIPNDTSDNSYQVMTVVGNASSRIDPGTIIDGFIIQDGNAKGGVASINGVPVNLKAGAGIFTNGSPSISNCIFRRNSTLLGGALYNSGNQGISSPVISNSFFLENYALFNGAAIFNQGNDGTSSPIISNCVFSNNSSQNAGGAIYSVGISSGTSNPVITNCTFATNRSGIGGAISNYQNNQGTCRAIITSCIFWNNVATSYSNDIDNANAASSINYSLTQSDRLGAGNKTAASSPFLNEADADGPDNVAGTLDDGLQIQCGSPAVNAGSNDSIPPGVTNEIAGNTRIRYERVDMGAYESPFTVITGEVLYVDSSIIGSGNGNSWAKAFKTLSEALLNVNSCGSKQIWVKQGTYFPDAGTTISRDSSFRILQNGIKLYGGFGGNDTTMATRNPGLHPTILSGDIGTANVNTDNSFHVITIVSSSSSPIDTSTRIEGFTIKSGNANVFGSFVYQGKYIVQNKGGAIHNFGEGSSNTCNPLIVACVFTNNNSTGEGGAVYNNALSGNSSPSFINCVFSTNNAVRGGAIYNYGYSGNSSPSLINCTFNANSATEGGVLYNNGTGSGISSPSISNAVFYGNTAISGAEIFNSVSGAVPTVTYSFTQSAINGTGNTTGTSSPFANAADPDGPDNMFATADDGLSLSPCSPALNNGNNNSVPTGINKDIAGNNRIQNSTVDRGAYEMAVLPPGDRLYVDSSIISGGDGSSWTSAFKTLSEALTAANACSVVKEIWVAKGTYFPTSSNRKDSSFRILRNGIKLFGGFAGGEITLSERDYKVHAAILSGEIGDPGTNSDNSSHIMTIVATPSANIDTATVVDGFIVKNGNAYIGSNITVNGQLLYVYYGGGIYNQGAGNGNKCSPSILNCTFIGNTGGRAGAIINAGQNRGNSSPSILNCTFIANGATAIFNNAERGGTSSPVITNCTFNDNNNGAILSIAESEESYANSSSIVTNCTFSGNSAGSGAAIYDYFAGNTLKGYNSPVYNKCVFSGNISGDRGGAVHNFKYSITPAVDSNRTVFIKCIFLGNSSSLGGAMYNEGSSPLLTNCIFEKNSSSNAGGAIYNDGREYKNVCSPTITNCTFANNSSVNPGGAIFNDASPGSYTVGGTCIPVFTNCIFWGNKKGGLTTGAGVDIANKETEPIVTYTLTKVYSSGGDGNIIAQDPKFVDTTKPKGPDNIWATADDGLRIQAGSPAINAGNNDSITRYSITTDITGAVRIQNITVDMGAYEGAITSIFSITSGAWNNPATWSCNCVPAGNSRVTIKAGHTVNVTAAMGNLQCGILMLEQTGVFNVTGGLFKVVGSN